ncbi:MAG: oligosaccharide flippase family protein [Bacteroidota bacterium]
MSSSLNGFSGIIKDSSYLTASNIIIFIISAVSYPIIGRLYSDVAFATFAIFQSLLILLQNVPNLGLNEALLLCRNSVFRNIIKPVYIFSIATILVILPFLFIINSYVINKSYDFVIALAIAIIVASLNLTFITALLRTSRFKIMSTLKVFEKSVFTLLALTFGLAKLYHFGLILGMLVSQISIQIAGLSFIRRYLKAPSGLFTLQSFVKKYQAFPKYSLPSSFIERLSSQLPILMLPTLVGNAITGQYAMAWKILAIPELLFAVSLSHTFYKRASELYRAKRNIHVLLIQTWKAQAVLGIFPLIISILFGPKLFIMVLGLNWASSGEIAQIIAVSVFLSFISVPTSSVFSILGKQHYGLYFSLLLLGVRFIALFYGLEFFHFESAIWIMVLSEAVIIILYNYLSFTRVMRWQKSML